MIKVTLKITKCIIFKRAVGNAIKLAFFLLQVKNKLVCYMPNLHNWVYFIGLSLNEAIQFFSLKTYIRHHLKHEENNECF